MERCPKKLFWKVIYMSGPKSYTPVLTAEQIARLEKEAEERRKEAEFQRILREFREHRNDKEYQEKLQFELANIEAAERDKIMSSISTFISQNVSFDFSKYAGERILTAEEVAKQKYLQYKEALGKYSSICEIMEVPMADCFGYDETRSDELIQQIIAETKRLESLQVERMKNKLIYDTSLMVLEEMGYKLIGNNIITKKSGVSVNSTLFRIDENTAVNLTCTSNGQYTFELVGVNEDGHAPSESEISKLLQLMNTQCHADFQVIREKLAKKGIVMCDTVERPPDKNYCRSKNIRNYCTVIAEEENCAVEQKGQIANGQI